MIAKKVDLNQKEIVDGLRRMGASVVHLHAVGRGVPDLLVGFRGMNYLFEVKSANGKLNSLQIEWHNCFKGNVNIVHNLEEAIGILYG